MEKNWCFPINTAACDLQHSDFPFKIRLAWFKNLRINVTRSLSSLALANPPPTPHCQNEFLPFFLFYSSLFPYFCPPQFFLFFGEVNLWFLMEREVLLEYVQHYYKGATIVEDAHCLIFSHIIGLLTSKKFVIGCNRLVFIGADWKHHLVLGLQYLV